MHLSSPIQNIHYHLYIHLWFLATWPNQIMPPTLPFSYTDSSQTINIQAKSINLYTPNALTSEGKENQPTKYLALLRNLEFSFFTIRSLVFCQFHIDIHLLCLPTARWSSSLTPKPQQNPRTPFFIWKHCKFGIFLWGSCNLDLAFWSLVTC